MSVTETRQPTASPTTLITNTTNNNTDTASPPVLHHFLYKSSTSGQHMMHVSSATRTWHRHRLSFAQLFSKDIKWVYDITIYHPRSLYVKPMTKQEEQLIYSTQTNHHDNGSSDQDDDQNKDIDKGIGKSDEEDEDKGQGKGKTKSSLYQQRGVKALRWCLIEVLSWTVLSNYHQIIMMFISPSSFVIKRLDKQTWLGQINNNSNDQVSSIRVFEIGVFVHMYIFNTMISYHPP
jgi:hypothetical protein